jgi:tetratricopeptide (TPR) repeat protein
LGRLDEALESYRECEAVALDSGNKHWLQMSFVLQSGVCALQGKLNDALGLIKRAEWVYREMGDYKNLMDNLGKQANLCRQLDLPRFKFAALFQQEAIQENLGVGRKPD